MPKTTVIRKRGTTVAIEAHAEVTMAPTAPIGKWATVFRHRLEDFTRDFAPSNKRPRWAHYGPRLRSTFSGAIRHNPVAGRVDFAVGSSADHAFYVDQGTGVFNGGGPWRARILPPWKRGSPSLYESTWVAGRSRVRAVWIKGQKGQHFMQRGLDRTMQSMRMRSYQLPDDPRMAKAVATAPQTLTAFLGGTPNNGAFRGQLEQWRKWRDSAWKSGRQLGDTTARKRRRDTVKAAKERQRSRRALDRSLSRESEQQRRDRRAENARRYRRRNREENRKPDRSLSRSREAERQKLMTRLRQQYRRVEYMGFHDGQWQFNVSTDGRDYRTLRVTPKSNARRRRY